MFKKIDPKIIPSAREKKIIQFWKENKVFEKSIENRREAKSYSFFDGPPFISGTPHYGTILSSIAKDVVPRYWTMKGFRVDRRWGWDCHGLPAENLVEKKLGLKSKKEIEEKVGIEKFVKECFRATTEIAGSWESIIDRVGRFVDFKNAYKTMDFDYMESVWWAFKELYNKGLVYQDSRISLYCPRCATPLANFEIAMDSSYEDVEDISLFVRFSLAKSAKETLGLPEKSNAFFIAWTTTPWTLLANTALAVNPDLDYVIVASKMARKDSHIILSEIGWKKIKEENGLNGRVIRKLKGTELLSLKYEKLADKILDIAGKVEIENLVPQSEKENGTQGWKIIAGDFVSKEEGSGIVHLAPAFGEDDYSAAKTENLPTILNVDEEGKFVTGKFKGRNVWEANADVAQALENKGLVLAQVKTVHSYPFCHRCHTKLIYKVQPAWFIKISAIKDKLISLNEEINWHPKHLKRGRFLKGIESAPDWNISRDRYFGTAIPVWICDKCQKETVAGSYDELYQLSGQRLEDYHRPYVDEITFECPEKCGGTAKRVSQILDCWVESGSMPFAERHYPFKNQEDFSQKFPADFVSEYIGQTRAWFYVMHTMATALFDKPAFKNVVTTGVIAGKDGKKMSKSLGNYENPMEVLEKYSADALRFYLMSSPIMEAKNIDFSVEKVAEIQKGMLRAWWNSYFFFTTYAGLDKWQPDREAPFKWSEPRSFKETWQKPSSVLDRWILSELHTLIRDTNELMDNYEIAKAARLLPIFIDKLSNWYIRRSRKRFWKSENDLDKNDAYQTLYETLSKLGQTAAPFVPFITEEIYQNINQTDDTLNQMSIHLTDFPEANTMLLDEELNKAMERVRQIVTLGLSSRAKAPNQSGLGTGQAGIKVRQPLQTLFVENKELINDELWELVKEEVNVKEIEEKEGLKKIIEENKLPAEISGMADREEAVAIDTRIGKDLRLEGEMRELVRQIQEARKKAGFNIEDRIVLGYVGKGEIFNRFGYIISGEVLAEKIYNRKLADKDYAFEVTLGGRKVAVTMKRIKK